MKTILWRAVATKALLIVQFFLTFFFGGGEQKALALLSKKGEEGSRSIVSQLKFDFFCYDDMPK